MFRFLSLGISRVPFEDLLLAVLDRYCVYSTTCFRPLRIIRLSLGSRRLLFFGSADILLGASRLQNFGTLVLFVCVSGPRTLLLAFAGRRLIKLVTIVIHSFLPWISGSLS